MQLRSLICLPALLLLAADSLNAADWPMSRYDAARNNASPAELPAQLHLQWVREYPALEPAWPDQPRMQFDAAYDPIVMGQRVFVASPASDCVTALSTETGAELWRFFTDGPVRFAPAAWEGKVYFASDDGHLYCVDAASGELQWKFRGGPLDRRVLGNERLISAWPARGAPVVADGKVYFAAGIWPFMGIFLHALDARTGEVVWSNSGDGAIYMKQPHNADSFAAVAPQGALVVAGDRLLVPGGRSIPAVYDRNTGRFLRYQLAENGKRGGGTDVAAYGKVFFNGGSIFDIETQMQLGSGGEQIAIQDGVLYAYRPSKCYAYDLKNASLKIEETLDRKGAKVRTARWSIKALGEEGIRAGAMIAAGPRLYFGLEGQVVAYRLPLPKADENAEPEWQAKVKGSVVRLLAGDDRLFAVTKEGRLYCFGAERPAQAQVWPADAAVPASSGPEADRARDILAASNVKAGYCVVWGIGSGKLAKELARRSELHVIVVDADEGKVARYRKELLAEGLYGTRIAVHVGEPGSFPLPPYLASLMVAEGGEDLDLSSATLRRTYDSLRPFGGLMCLPTEDADTVKSAVARAELVSAKVESRGGLLLVSREGPLPGSSNWTHEHADAANTRVSRDQLVKAPLGLLWFGGVSHHGILPRHGHGPQPQVIDGRILIQGVDFLRCMDIYTGRVFWETPLPGVGAFYNNTSHQPGANASGTNFISTPDGVYVVYQKKCLLLDLDTGRQKAEFSLPLLDGTKETPRWGYINVDGDFLVGGADPLFDPRMVKPATPATADSKEPEKKPESKPVETVTRVLTTLSRGSNDNMSSSKHLVVMDRRSGKVRWTASARHGFRHNAICIGGGRLYAIDRLSGPQIDRMKRRGETPDAPPRLVAFDLQTGKEIWSTDQTVFGTWLSYSEKHDVLIESGRPAGDTINDEARGMRAYQAGDGVVLWYGKSHSGPAMIHGDDILNGSGSGYELLTGKPKMRLDPLTGQLVPWKWSRTYGCNTPMASQHLLTFRSGAAGYYDLCHDGGTGNWGGFRSSCTNNLVVAGGVLCAPDYTRTCTCLYQNQTSLALVPMQDIEMWTFFGPQQSKGGLRRAGINLGAPGDRRAPDGNLWCEYPAVGGRSPVIPLKVAGDDAEYFRKYSALVHGDLNWVAASGIEGARSITIPIRVTSTEIPTVWHWMGQMLVPAPVGPSFLTGLPKMELPTDTVDKDGEGAYTVRLHFAEPDNICEGERVFDVSIQGQKVLEGFDIVKEAGGVDRALVKEFKGVRVSKEIVVSFTARRGVPLLCGIDLQAE